MWIEELDITGFKQLRGTFRFGHGLTVIYGPNEAGKTALQDAVLRTIFGFSASERRLRHEVSALTRVHPWTGDASGITATVREARDDRSLRIRWNFDDHSVTVNDHDTGEDFSSEVRGKRQDVLLGKWLLGLELEDYREACCLFQVAVKPVVHSDGLVGALRVAIEQGAPDGGGVTAADELLKSFLSTKLGLNSRWYTPLGGGECARVAHELDQATAALGDAQAARQEIRKLSAEIGMRNEDLADMRRELSVVEQRLRLTDCLDLRRRWDEVERQREQIARLPEHPVVLPAAERERVAALRTQVDENAQRVAQLADEVAGRATAVAGLEQQRRECTTARDRLEAYADWDASAKDRVRGLQAQLGDADHDPEEAADPMPERDPELARFRAERETLHGFVRGETGATWRPGLLGAAVVLAVLSAVAATISPLALVGLGLAAIVAFAARRRTAEPQDDSLAAALATFGADSIEQLERRAEDEDRAIATAEGRAEERERQSGARIENRSSLESQLRDALTSVGVEVNGSLGESARGYLIGCDRHAEHEQLTARLAALDGELLRAREPRRDLDNRRRELAGFEEALLAALAQHGIRTQDLGEAEAAYSALAARAQAEEEVLGDVTRAEEARRVALDGQTSEQLQAALEQAEMQLRQHVALHGELAAEPGDRAELNRQVSELHGRIETVVSEAAGLDAVIDEREAASGDPAALEEDISVLRHRQKQIESGGHAIRIAREGLAAAAREAHRAFAPHLNDALARDLPRVTSGRYVRATVGDGLDIKVVTPETGGLVSVEMLSRGTQDQIALVERLAVARMLDPTTGHAPLLLDDPFGHTDPDRRTQVLELIAELAASRQIILTTEDPAVAEAVQHLSQGVLLIALPGPSARADRPLVESPVQRRQLQPTLDS